MDVSNAVGSLLLTLKKPDIAEGFLYSAVKLSNWTDAQSIANLAECIRTTGDINLAKKVALKGMDSMGNKDSSGLIPYIEGTFKLDKQLELLEACQPLLL